MASKYWLKLYHEMLDDPKVMTLRPSLRWRFIEALLVAGEVDDDGYLPPVSEYSWRVRDIEDVVETEFVELADVGLLSRDDTRYFVTKFKERQEADTPTERWRRWKKRQEKEEYYDQQTNPQRSANDTFDRIDIDIDKDIDTEKEEEGSPAGDNLTEKEKSQLMFSALAEVCGYSLDKLTKKARGMLNQTEKQLREAGYSAEFIRRDFMAYWRKEDWRGQKGQKPTPGQVLEGAPKAVPQAEAADRSKFEQVPSWAR